MKKAGMLLVLALGLSGCGTMMTSTGKGISQLQTERYARATKCESIPRVYSGVAFDTCATLLGETSGSTTTQDWLFLPFLVDSLASFAADTVLLPYTIYQQVDSGSLPVGGRL